MTTVKKIKKRLEFATEDISDAAGSSIVGFLFGALVTFAEGTTKATKKVTKVTSCEKCGHEHVVKDTDDPKTWKQSLAETNTTFSRMRENGNNGAWVAGLGTLLHKTATHSHAWAEAGRITTTECLKNKKSSKAVGLKPLKRRG